MQYSILNDAETGDIFVTAIIPGDSDPYVAGPTHPNLDSIVTLLLSGDASSDEVRDQFDVAEAAGRRFRTTLSERVKVDNGRIFFDGDEVANPLTKQVVRFLDEDVEDWQPLVAFFEKVQANPSEHSREQLYSWLDQHDFTILSNGDFVGYKGVRSDGHDGYESINTGFAVVNGQEVNGSVPNNVGDVVEMPRSMVAFDPAQGCSVGLHVGTYEYARSFSRDVVLEVHVNPRDVVSVPTDCNWAKVRTCRYEVEDVIDAPYATAVVQGPSNYTDASSIEDGLAEAITDGVVVAIDYVAEDGSESYSRGILPLQFDEGRYGSKSVLAKDVEKNQPRYFRLDRIKRLAA